MPAARNKFGFLIRPRPPTAVPVRPRADGASDRSPKRPRDDVVASSNQDRAKRVKPARKKSKPPIIEISDDEDSGKEGVGDNDRSIAASGIQPPAVQPPPIASVPSSSHIVDLTIDDPPSDNSPETSVGRGDLTKVAPDFQDPLRSSQLEIDLRARQLIADASDEPDLMLEGEDNTDVQFQFEFQKACSNTFLSIIKPEVEDELPCRLQKIISNYLQAPMPDRFRSMTLEDDRVDQARSFTVRDGQGPRLGTQPAGMDGIAVEAALLQSTERPLPTIQQRAGLADVPRTTFRNSDVAFEDVQAKPTQHSTLAISPTFSSSRSPPVVPLVSRLAPAPNLFPPALTRSRLPVPVNTQESSALQKDRRDTARSTVFTSKSSTASASRPKVPVSSSSVQSRYLSAIGRTKPSRYHSGTIASTAASQKTPSASKKRHETPFERLMPRNTLTPMRSTHFDGLLHCIAEKQKQGIQRTPRIFQEQIQTPQVQGLRLELFWKVLMKLVGADRLFLKKHDRLSNCIDAVNWQLGEEEQFEWEEGLAIAEELQNQRRMILTRAKDPMLMFTRDGQEVMG